VQTETISLDETDCFSSSFINYIQQKEELKPFYNQFPSIDNFKEIIEKRSFSSGQRKILSDTLSNQYQELELSDQVNENIELLRQDTTFTITTGHQLNIFTCPL